MTVGLQPFISDAVMALHAPTQAWSGRYGDLGAQTIDGFYHGDTRFVRCLELSYSSADGELIAAPEWISTAQVSASVVEFDALLRGVDDHWPDPKVRLTRKRHVANGLVTETLTVTSHLGAPLQLRLRQRVTPDFAPLQEVKAGTVEPRQWNATTSSGTASSGQSVTAQWESSALTVTAPGASVVAGDEAIDIEWNIECEALSSVSVEWSAQMDDPSLVVHGAAGPAAWAGIEPDAALDPRLRRWVTRALEDLEALRLTLPGHPDDTFLAAGAPWFLTLFGRDSLWAARLMLSADVEIAASTLRVLARLQGSETNPAIAEQPGKIMHELRSGELALPGEGVLLPPLYYGTVDATPLWVCLLADAAAFGMPENEVRALLPHLRRAMEWIIASAGDSGFLDYVDETGHGLSNQGWKDSGDSIQWRDGSLAKGPIALSEVQGYAYEAATRAADLLESLGEEGAEELRAWATDLRARFREHYWVTTPEGTYPAIALDADGKPVDTLTSNIGHLLGTGLLDPAEEATVSELLVGASMSSGFGVRTMSTGAAGYWPLSYHGGSVWAHDSAIIARGMALAGRNDDARTVVAGLLAAAEAFEFRMPELHAGDASSDRPTPAPYPASCRPQAWSAAAAVTCWDILAEG